MLNRDKASSSCTRSYLHLPTPELLRLVAEFEAQYSVMASKIECIKGVIAARTELKPGRIFTATWKLLPTHEKEPRCVCLNVKDLPFAYTRGSIYGVVLGTGALKIYNPEYFTFAVEEP